MDSSPRPTYWFHVRSGSQINREFFRSNKKLLLFSSNHSFVRFEYEKMTLFCFICGNQGHGESFCPL
ncbi:hypothetical protein GQ457_15G021000 [Hibiscus cannabinus]